MNSTVMISSSVGMSILNLFSNKNGRKVRKSIIEVMNKIVQFRV